MCGAGRRGRLVPAGQVPRHSHYNPCDHKRDNTEGQNRDKQGQPDQNNHRRKPLQDTFYLEGISMIWKGFPSLCLEYPGGAVVGSGRLACRPRPLPPAPETTPRHHTEPRGAGCVGRPDKFAPRPNFLDMLKTCVIVTEQRRAALIFEPPRPARKGQ